MKKHIGSNFDDFLKEENLLKETTVVATERVFVYQLKKRNEKQKIDKSNFATRLETAKR